MFSFLFLFFKEKSKHIWLFISILVDYDVNKLKLGQNLKKNIFFVKHFLKIIIHAGLKHYFTVVGNLRLCRSNWCARAHARGNPYTCLWCKGAFFLFNKTITLNCVFIVRMFIAQPIDWEKGNEKISYLHVYINLCNMF